MSKQPMLYPCLWSDHGVEDKPWRNVYKEALEYVKLWVDQR